MSKTSPKLSNMFCLDIFLMGLPTAARKEIQQDLSSKNSTGHSLQCYDIIAVSLKKLQSTKTIDMQYLKIMSQNMKWQENLEYILLQPFQALVLTNIERHISWVNEGFEKMTGYISSEVVGKKPTFLQGKNPCVSTQTLFRKKLQEGKNFSVTITNYRKNGSEYLCRVEVFPLHNSYGRTSHFLALEQEITV